MVVATRSRSLERSAHVPSRSKETTSKRKHVTSSSSKLGVTSENTMATSSSPQRKTRKYRARTSLMDLHGDSAIERSEFKGWYHLSCLVVTYYLMCYSVDLWHTTGTPFDLKLADALLTDIVVVFVLVIVMMGASCMAVPLSLLYMSRKLPFWFVHSLQHFYQFVLIMSSLAAVFHFNFGITQSALLVMETVVVYMKCHSFTTFNREASVELGRLQVSVDENSSSSKSRMEIEDVVHNENLKQKFPKSVTLLNYIWFLCIPTLVYEISYPLKKRISWIYVLEKVAIVVGGVSMIYAISSAFIIPIVHENHEKNGSIIAAVFKLIMPVWACHLSLFFIIFEGILNGVAELTGFADRHFYDPWWNSTCFSEYARDWNKPVHEWLLRHVYRETRSEYRFSKVTAMLATFLFSALLHEMVIFACLRRFRPWLFLFQMSQIPLIYAGKIWRGTTFGNLFFWTGLITGPPLMTVLYVILP